MPRRYFVKTCHSKNKAQLNRNTKANVIPVRKLKIGVDKNKVLANGVVSAEKANQIVDEITWDITGNYIMKNELVVWDMLAHFNWERPIYFSITMGKDSFYGLEKYFQQEGFAFKHVLGCYWGQAPGDEVIVEACFV